MGYRVKIAVHIPQASTTPQLERNRSRKIRSDISSCTFCADCVDNILFNVCPNCGGGFVPPTNPPDNRMAGRTFRREAAAFGQARAFLLHS